MTPTLYGMSDMPTREESVLEQLMAMGAIQQTRNQTSYIQVNEYPQGNEESLWAWRFMDEVGTVRDSCGKPISRAELDKLLKSKKYNGVPVIGFGS